MGNKNSQSCVASVNLIDGVYKQSSADCDQIKKTTTQSEESNQGNISFSREHFLRTQSVYSLISTRTKYNEFWLLSLEETSFLPVFPLITNTGENSFIFLKKISSGTFSQVYLVRKPRETNLYVAKIYSKEQIKSSHDVERAKEQVQILSACNHHFVQKQITCWQSKKHLYIVSEFYGGGDLYQLMNRVKLCSELIRIYIAQIALALDFIHNLGIIHRDVKPENLFVCSADHNLKLGDFDLARWLSYGDRTKSIVGTLRYMGMNTTLYCH